RRVPTQRAGIPGRVLARIAAPVADVHRAGIEILRARAARRHLRIDRAVGAGAVAGLGGVALIHRRPTLGARGRQTVRRAVSTRPVAALGHVAGARGRRAHGAGRLLGFGRPGAPRAAAALRWVTGPGRGAALDRRGLEDIGRAVVGDAVAAFRDVARARRRPAHRARVARRVLAGIAAAVALIERARIAVVGARGPTRLLGIRRTPGTRARAGFRQVAHAGRRTAHGAGGLERIGRTGRARPVAGLGHIANAGRGPTHRARRRLRIG